MTKTTILCDHVRDGTRPEHARFEANGEGHAGEQLGLYYRCCKECAIDASARLIANLQPPSSAQDGTFTNAVVTPAAPPDPHDQPHALSEEAQAVRAICVDLQAWRVTVDRASFAKRVIALIDAHANDLQDMSNICEEVSKVYMHIADLSKCTTAAGFIIDAHNAALERAEQEGIEHGLKLVERAIGRMRSEGADLEVPRG